MAQNRKGSGTMGSPTGRRRTIKLSVWCSFSVEARWSQSGSSTSATARGRKPPHLPVFTYIIFFSPNFNLSPSLSRSEVHAEHFPTSRRPNLSAEVSFWLEDLRHVLEGTLKCKEWSKGRFIKTGREREAIQSKRSPVSKRAPRNDFKSLSQT